MKALIKKSSILALGIAAISVAGSASAATWGDVSGAKIRKIHVEQANLSGEWECTLSSPGSKEENLTAQVLEGGSFTASHQRVSPKIMESLGIEKASALFERPVDDTNVQIFLAQANARQAEYFSTRYMMVVIIPGSMPMTLPIQGDQVTSHSIEFKSDTGESKTEITCSKAQGSARILPF